MQCHLRTTGGGRIEATFHTINKWLWNNSVTCLHRLPARQRLSRPPPGFRQAVSKVSSFTLPSLAPFERTRWPSPADCKTEPPSAPGPGAPACKPQRGAQASPPTVTAHPRDSITTVRPAGSLARLFWLRSVQIRSLCPGTRSTDLEPRESRDSALQCPGQACPGSPLLIWSS